MTRAHQWWDGTAAKWSAQDYTWTFPNVHGPPAVLQFGYLEKEGDKLRYQSAEFHYIAFDELTQFSESQYTYLFSRLRRLKREALHRFGVDIELPLRMRGATNPGGFGHEWVKKRFIGSIEKPASHPQRLYIPSRLEDNPSLDQEAYEESLAELDPITRAQLRMGDWSADARGGKFQRTWFLKEIDRPRKMKKVIRYWDTAATSPKKLGDDPDYTAGVKMGVDERNEFWVLDVVRFRDTPAVNEDIIASTAAGDGKSVEVWMEQEPGSSGKHMLSHYHRNVLFGYSFHAHRTTGSKEVRANPLSAAAESGIVHIMVADWNEAFLDEHANFPDGAHDDQVDADSGAHDVLTRMLKRESKRQGSQHPGY